MSRTIKSAKAIVKNIIQTCNDEDLQVFCGTDQEILALLTTYQEAMWQEAYIELVVDKLDEKDFDYIREHAQAELAAMAGSY